MKTTYAYLAGIIDSDGYVSIARKLSGYVKKDGTRSLYFEVRIGLGQTNELIPNLFQSVFPGYRGSHQPKNPKHKRWYLWQAFNEKARQPLKKLMPFLRLKKPQAVAALKLLDMMDRQNVGRFMALALTAEELQAREELYKEVSHLNAPRNRRAHLLETPAPASPPASRKVSRACRGARQVA